MSLSIRTSYMAFRSATVLLLVGILMLMMAATVWPSSSLDAKEGSAAAKPKRTATVIDHVLDEQSLAASTAAVVNKQTGAKAIPVNAVSSSLLLADSSAKDEGSPQVNQDVIKPAVSLNCPICQNKSPRILLNI
eukprot:scaffold59807_cov31-Cyclotella_meneghiniana.AAC.6